MGETFGQRLRIARIKSTKTADTVSKILGTTVGAYYKYEADESCPNIKTILALCEILGCDPNFLFSFDDTSSSWSQLAIKCGQTISNFPVTQQQIAHYLINGIQLQVIAQKVAEESRSINKGKFDLTTLSI